ncbi:hypothetical protein DFJ74DRAFT_124478 [Hyaloraphidium curvatum]|nr:hypothetical protein DFJ74DRAFT_124478 [Hyaloraphidium curvatum]
MVLNLLWNAARLVAIISPFPFYAYLWHYPQKFVDVACTDGADPSHRMAQISTGLKALQILALLTTASFSSHVFPPWWSLLLFAGGQYLNVRAYQLLGETGIYYGNRFGRNVPWVSEFPYGTIKDPQYWGSIMSLLGVTCWIPLRWVLPWIAGYFLMMEVERKEPKTKAKVKAKREN